MTVPCSNQYAPSQITTTMANLCCQSQRCMTPTEPFLRLRLKSGTRRLTAIPGDSDSRYTSTRSADLREIQELLEGANLTDSIASVPEERSFESSTGSSKQSKVVAFFRRRLSRQLSKSHKKEVSTDQERIKQAKHEIRTTLLSEEGPEAGGYDSDAPALGNVEDVVPPEDGTDERGRSRVPRQSMQLQDWSLPEGTHRFSMSLTPPRMSVGSRRLPRSRSESSLLSPPGTPSKVHMRLPSFCTDRDTSQNWKRGVMESLQISSPSTSVLMVPPGLPSKGVKSATWPLRDITMPLTEPESPPVAEHTSLPQNARPSEDTLVGSRAKPSWERGMTPHLSKPSSSSSSRPHFFGRPLRGVDRSSTTSVHLYNMGISRHLRSTSSFGTGAVRTQPATATTTTVPTRAPTPVRRHRQVSNSGFTSADIPDAWGVVVDLEHKTDDVSSTYSTAPNSPTRSQCDLVRTSLSQTRHHPELQEIASQEEVNLVTASSRRSSAQAENTTSPTTLPKNSSASNLSEKSTRSSKTSRFKEDFDKLNSKKSKKRSSIVNLFSRTLGSKSRGIDNFDGQFDEPKRLQRAMALADQNDAAGLLAKAIREKQKEKSVLFLKGNKDAAKHEIFRQRSSSFCRPHGDSVTVEQGGLIGAPSFPRNDTLRRSTSETLLKPDFASPMFGADPNSAMPRAHSTGHLTPEFKMPVFSGPAHAGAGSRAGSPGRSLSVSLDPTAMGPGVDTLDRRPSFQLNDMPVVLGTPKSLTVNNWPTTPPISTSKIAVSVLEDTDVDMGPWSRYPSHTREKRCGSAGLCDDVKTHDFAYDIDLMNVAFDASDNDAANPANGKKRGKSKKKSSTLPKSKSMTFGKELIRGYGRMFRSSSVEWLSYGKGHRSSISAGGTLEHPELEILPPVFAPMPTIPDREEDLGLGFPAQNAFEMQAFRRDHRHHDHGHSFVAGVGPHIDGTADRKETNPDSRMDFGPNSKVLDRGINTKDFSNNPLRLGVTFGPSGIVKKTAHAAPAFQIHLQASSEYSQAQDLGLETCKHDQSEFRLADFKHAAEELVPENLQGPSRLGKLFARKLRNHKHANSASKTSPASVMEPSSAADVIRPDESRRIASFPAIIGQDRVSQDGIASDALHWSRHYESCVFLPPQSSHSTASRPLNFIHNSEYHYTATASSSGSDGQGLIDKMLASNPTSAAGSPLPSPLTSPLISPFHTIPGSSMEASAAAARRAHAKSVSSVTSIRASSMDLLKTLREAEERERMRVLEMLTRSRTSLDGRRASSDGGIRTIEQERNVNAVERHQIHGTLGRTWPDALLKGKMAVEAS